MVQVQTYHDGNLAGSIQTTSDAFQESGCKVTITPQFSNSLIVCYFVSPVSMVAYNAATDLKTRLLLNSVQYCGDSTTGFMNRSDTTFDSYSPTTFETIHSTLSAGTAVEFKVQFKSKINGEPVKLAISGSSITMTVSEIAQ